jgi:AcrR family transcriptional regulator
MDLADRRDITQPASARERAAAERRDAILTAAKSVFMEEGYELASMDRIAERAGTTKRTVYDRVGPKEAVFGAVVERACSNFVNDLPGPGDLPTDPHVGLRLAAEQAMGQLASPGCARLIRLITAEGERRPQYVTVLRQAFADGEAKFRAYLDACVAAGTLKAHDTALSARLFSDAISHAASSRGLLGEDPADPMARRAMAAVVELLLARWG